MYRVYVDSNQGGQYCQLGWIVKDDATHCMNCKTAFSGLHTKYHCKACGDVCCSTCCDKWAKIVELGSPQAHRVCRRCHTTEVSSFFFFLPTFCCIYIYII
jgi:hypothetical protein